MANIITMNLGTLINNTLINNASISAQKNQYSKMFNHMNSSYIKTHQVYEIEKDLLSLSVCWKRLREGKDPSYVSSPTYIGSLLEAELFRRVNDSDIELANTIRDYYSKKLMMWALTSDRQLTPFRKDLSHFITSDGKIFKEEMIPLAFRLPEMYEYDLFVGARISESKNLTLNLHPTQYLFLGKVNRTIRKLKKVEFWFLNHQRALCRLVVEPNNILVPILENLLDSSPHKIFVSSGRLQKRVLDDLIHFDFATLA